MRCFANAGTRLTVENASEVDDITPYRAVVLGGALYMGRWHPAARRFARRHERALGGRPVWIFSSGPLDRSADDGTAAVAPGVARTVSRLKARGHATFGGRLTADTPGLGARMIAKRMTGDFRNVAQIRAWAHGIGEELASSEPRTAAARRPSA